ncbi:hypothetical protein GGD40_005596 [Paraburkholderia bryophila]|uniref:Uncharacterized protein n=1 Tax=Paraburkholderia bryophila TaxID=420952 RepID=A0A7Y9WTJ0_9BURK|nr:hypothetical protein [Paraburkholderia bryophila]
MNCTIFCYPTGVAIALALHIQAKWLEAPCTTLT